MESWRKLTVEARRKLATNQKNAFQVSSAFMHCLGWKVEGDEATSNIQISWSELSLTDFNFLQSWEAKWLFEQLRLSSHAIHFLARMSTHAEKQGEKAPMKVKCMWLYLAEGIANSTLIRRSKAFQRLELHSEIHRQKMLAHFYAQVPNAVAGPWAASFDSWRLLNNYSHWYKSSLMT